MSSVLHPGNYSLTTSAGAVSHAGVRRTNNQDAFLTDEDLNAFVVADGVAGSAGGEIASAIACSQILDVFEDEFEKIGDVDREESINSAISKAFHAADRRIICERTMQPFLCHMATTALLAFVDTHSATAGTRPGEGRLYVGNAGDSRAILIRGGTVTQLTHDHTIAVGLEEAGLLNHEEALRHPGRNALYMNLGGSLYDGPQLFSCHVCEGDRLVLVTDGITAAMTNSEIADAMASESDAQSAANHLAFEAIEEGAGDDVTCVVVQIRK